VIVWWYILKWGTVCSRELCHLQGILRQGQEYGRNLQIASCSPFSVCRRDIVQLDAECSQGNVTVLAGVSIADMRKFLTKDINITTTTTTTTRYIKIHWTPKAYCKRHKFLHWTLSIIWGWKTLRLLETEFGFITANCIFTMLQILRAGVNKFRDPGYRPTKFCTVEPNIFGPHSGSCVMSPFWGP
jgi:hypothetical protein